ncbi:MAG: glycosyltransferase family 4 protein [Hyphomonadaceae bacterium]
MRLLVLTPEFAAWGGGIATFYRNSLKHLQAMGVSIRVIEGSATSNRETAGRETVDGIATERLELKRFVHWHERYSRLSAAPMLRRHLAASCALWEQAVEGPTFDVVEATDWGLLFLAPISAGTHPTIVQGHGSCGQISAYDPIPGDETSDLIVRLMELAFLARASDVQTYSEINALEWSGELGRAIRMIRPAWVAAPKSRQALSISDRGLVVGRVQSWKGPDTLCEALRILGPNAPRMDWIGREVPWGRNGLGAGVYLRNTYPDVWGNLVTHHAPLAPASIADKQASAAFNLIPSAWDVFNFTVAEALASGRPTIVSSGAGASELIVDGENGFVFPAGDPDALARAIERSLALTPIKQKQMAQNALATLESSLVPDRIAAQRYEAYQAAITTHAASPAVLPSWLAQICSPPDENAGEDNFLENHPLRMLVGHAARRLVRKVTS